MNWRGQRRAVRRGFQNNCIPNESRDACPSSEEVRQGHVISKIADAAALAYESQWRFVYIFWKLRVPWKDRLITFLVYLYVLA